MLNNLEVVTLFVEDIAETKAFYAKVFAADVIYEDDVSYVLNFSGLMINLLQAAEAPELVEPMVVAAAGAGTRFMLTLRVDDADAVCARLRDMGVTLLNGPVDRPWGRRTAAFADPAGHVFEIAQVLV
ncbi:VOC family protein [Rhizobium sp. XQZ8]|uniref:VOC family protein n=1 Tax=Rhizobium populisoli TaxID=2859785 RepID=UPI001CA4E119|nr:VOC family protein [Rhizobium populisoli]MBW6420489.1 VOC family protein [Rhizobium populisoli]